MRRRRQAVRDLTPLDVIRVRRAVREGDHAKLAAWADDFGFAHTGALVTAADLVYESATWARHGGVRQ